MDRLKRGLRAISWALAQQGWLEFLRTGDGKPIEDDEGRLRGVSLPSVGDQKGKIIAMIHPPPRLDGGRSSSSSACCCLSNHGPALPDRIQGLISCGTFAERSAD